jgi:DNA modification methylase
MLAGELAGLQADGFNLALTGFDEDELENLLASSTPEESAEGEDDAQAVSEKAISRLGDLWLLDGHRLLCGDSTDEETVRRLFEGQKAHLFSTDPPYLVDYTGADRPGGVGKDWSDKYNEVDIKDADGFFTSVFTVAKKILKNDAAWYCWHAHKRAALIEQVWEKLGVLNHQQIIWFKPAAVHSYSYYPWQHEPCLMGWQKGHKPRHDGSNSHALTSVWELDWEGKARAGKTEHPTQKPVEVFAIPMRKHTKEGEICYEPFSGSGSQLIAGEKCHRRVFAMELSPPFVDAAIKRWEKFTGKQAVLDTGKTFAEITKERLAQANA